MPKRPTRRDRLIDLLVDFVSDGRFSGALRHLLRGPAGRMKSLSGLLSEKSPGARFDAAEASTLWVGWLSFEDVHSELDALIVAYDARTWWTWSAACNRALILGKARPRPFRPTR